MWADIHIAHSLQVHVICTKIFANRLKVNPQSRTVLVPYYVGFNQFEKNPTKHNK